MPVFVRTSVLPAGPACPTNTLEGTGRAAAGAAKDGVALCALREEGLFLATHLVARAENGSMLVSEFARNFVKRLKLAGLYQPIPSESANDAHCAA